MHKKGKKLSDEHKDKLSKAGKGRIVSDETKKKNSISNTGVKRSEETKKRVSEALTGLVRCDNAKKNISAGLKKSYENGDRGMYITPYGEFCNSDNAALSNLNSTMIYRLCRKKNYKLSKQAIQRNLYFENNYNLINKTGAELGFSFLHKQK